MKLNPYLSFDGQCEAAFLLYAELFNGKILAMHRYAGSPMTVAPEWQEKIMHASLDVGGTILMGSDPPPGHTAPRKGFAVTLTVGDAAEAERVFVALAEGGTVEMPLAQTFWAIRYGQLVDRFGTPWAVNCERAD